MANHRLRHHLRPAAICVPVIALLLSGTAGCGPEVRAREVLSAGQPVEAVRLYEQAVRQKPEDVGLREELARAQDQAAQSLALEAQQAVSLGQLDVATLKAEQAARFDGAFKPLVDRTRDLQARDLLATADRELAEGRFESARNAAGRAAALAPELTAASTMLHRVDVEQALSLARDARALAAAGRFERSRVIADQAVGLDPGGPETANLLATISRQERESRFDAAAIEFRRLLRQKKLDDAAASLASLRALGVRADQLQILQAELDAPRGSFESALAQARSQRDAGEFEQALDHFRTALEIFPTSARAASEQQACRADLEFANLQARGRDAFARGDFDDAAASFRAALDLRGDEGTSTALRAADAAGLRLRMQSLLDTGDLAGAVVAGRRLQMIAPDPDQAVRLDEITRRLVDEALAESASLDADGRPGDAVNLLRRTIAIEPDPELGSRLTSMRVRALLEQASEADRRGEFRSARDLYLEALALDGTRAGIAARVDDVRSVAAYEQRTADAEAHAAALQDTVESLNAEIATRERQLGNLLADLRRAESEINELTQCRERLEYDVRHLRQQISHLEHDLYQLKCDNDRLESALRRAKRDADSWRRRYERERSRGDRAHGPENDHGAEHATEHAHAAEAE